MLRWFKKKRALKLEVDIHSHLLPEVDDGVRSYEEAFEILRAFQEAGYTKVITTPHINHASFPNTPDIIQQRFEAFQRKLKASDIRIDVEVAAEYFIDDHFLKAIDQGGLLSFGDKYVLMETAFYTRPLIFDEVVFRLKSAGYTPVLAHPERYRYLEDDLGWLEEIKARGVKLQVTLSSLIGAYGKTPMKTAGKLLDRNMVDFLGSDIHRASQIKQLKRAWGKKMGSYDLLNRELV